LALEAELLQNIKKKKFDEVESIWMSRIESSPADLEWFFEVAREMRAAKGHVKLAELLVFLAQTLAEQDDWELAFDVLEEAIALVPRNKMLREATMELVRQRYEEHGDLDDVFAFFGFAECDDLARAWTEMREWLRFSEGEGFYVFGRGLGKVAETNLQLQKVKLNFEKTTPLVVRRDEARKLLTWVPRDHFMMRRVEDPEVVHSRAREDPGAILGELLQLFGRPLTAPEIRECMAGVVEGGQWAAWWSRAKAHPQVLVSPHNRKAFEWSDSAAAAEETLLARFAAANLERKLEIGRRHSRRRDVVRPHLAHGLREELERLDAGATAPALEVLFVLDELGEPWPEMEVRVDDALRSDDVVETIANVRDRRHREKLYRRLREVHPEDWARLYHECFFREPDFRLMTVLYEALLQDAPGERMENLVAEILANPRRTPRPFVWFTKNALSREELVSKVNHGLLVKITDALERPEFRELKTPLREQFEPGGLAFTVFEQSDRDGVDLLLNLVDSTGGLEEHRKTEIRRAIFRKYPHIRKRLDDEVLFVTAASVEAKRRELDQLVRVEIPQNAQAIQTAREFGDLSENFEYHAARQKHELLSSRAAQLHEELRHIRLIDPGAVDPSRVAIGTRVRLEPVQGGPSRWVTILGPWDSDPASGVFSYQSDFAQGLAGHAPGETIRIEGEDYRIGAIEVWQSPPSEAASPAGGAERDDPL
jgi:transcription elongation GreA/GreB family factor